MKQFILFIILFLFSINAFALLSPTPEEKVILTKGDRANLASGKIVVGNSSGKADDVTLSGDATISNAGVLTLADNAVPLAELALTDGQIAVGNASNNAVDVAMSGDVTIVSSGVTTIADNAVDKDDIADPAASAEGHYGFKYLRAIYDVAVDGSSTVTAIDLGVDLPANANILFGYFAPTTQFADSGSGEFQIYCEDDQNLYAYADITSVGAGVETLLIPQWGAANVVRGIAAACDLSVKSSGVVLDSGAMDIFIFYSVHN